MKNAQFWKSSPSLQADGGDVELVDVTADGRPRNCSIVPLSDVNADSEERIERVLKADSRSKVQSV